MIKKKSDHFVIFFLSCKYMLNGYVITYYNFYNSYHVYHIWICQMKGQSYLNAMKMITAIEIHHTPKNMVKCLMPYNIGHGVIFLL